MPGIDLQRLNLKIGTKQQYEDNKASLNPDNTLVMTPLNEEFTSNTSNDGKGHFSVSGLTVNTLSGSVGGNVTTTNVNPVYLEDGEIKALTASSGGSNRPVYVNAGKIQPIYATVGRVGDASVPQTQQNVYLNAGTITAQDTKMLVRTDRTGYISLAGVAYNDDNQLVNTLYTCKHSSTTGNYNSVLEWHPVSQRFRISLDNGSGALAEIGAVVFGLQRVTSW